MGSGVTGYEGCLPLVVLVHLENCNDRIFETTKLFERY